MNDLKDILDFNELKEPRNLYEIIEKSKNLTSKCDQNKTVIHRLCFDDGNNDQIIPLCPNALLYILIKVIAIKPSLLDDDTKTKVVHYFKDNNIRAKGLVYSEYLAILSTSKTKSMSWIKYETLLSRLIKEKIYQPSTMANEVLSVVKSEMDADIACNFCPVINSCVKYCREVSYGCLEEEEEKWCEIIDWISWFLATNDDNF